MPTVEEDELDEMPVIVLDEDLEDFRDIGVDCGFVCGSVAASLVASLRERSPSDTKAIGRRRTYRLVLLVAAALPLALLALLKPELFDRADRQHPAALASVESAGNRLLERAPVAGDSELGGGAPRDDREPSHVETSPQVEESWRGGLPGARSDGEVPPAEAASVPPAEAASVPPAEAASQNDDIVVFVQPPTATRSDLPEIWGADGPLEDARKLAPDERPIPEREPSPSSGQLHLEEPAPSAQAAEDASCLDVNERPAEVPEGATGDSGELVPFSGGAPPEPPPSDSENAPGGREAQSAVEMRRPVDFGKDCLSSGCHGDMEEPDGAHSSLSSETCKDCHGPAGDLAQHRFRFRELIAELCLRCHDRRLVNPKTGKAVRDIARRILSARFQHGPVKMGDCDSCHSYHSLDRADLLRERYSHKFYQEFSESTYVLCFRCHERQLVVAERTTTATRFRDGDRNLHHLHVNRRKGRSCRVCHEIHASDLPRQVRKEVSFGSKGWMLPIAFEKTSSGGTCSPGCHRTRAYDTRE